MKLPVVPPDIARAILPALARFPRQEYHHAPYGILWYLVNKPIGILARGKPVNYMLWTQVFTLPILVYLGQTQSFFFQAIFASVYVFHLFKATWNVSILWLCLLGLIHPILLIVPILAKFPIGNPASFRKTWGFIFHMMTYKKSPFYYFTMGIVWIAVALGI